MKKIELRVRTFINYVFFVFFQTTLFIFRVCILYNKIILYLPNTMRHFNLNNYNAQVKSFFFYFLLIGFWCYKLWCLAKSILKS